MPPEAPSLRQQSTGRPPAPEPVNYTHTICDDDRSGLWVTWWRLEGGGERVPTQHAGPPAADLVPSELTLHEWQLAVLKPLYERDETAARPRYVFKRWAP